MCCYRTLYIVIYIFAKYKIKFVFQNSRCITVRTFYVPQTSVVRVRLAYFLERKYDRFIQSEGMEDKMTPTEIILGRLFGWQSVDFSVTKIMGVKSHMWKI